MMRAMAEAVCERGYSKTPVAEVLKRAGVSRETFYKHFSDKQDCFLAAFDRCAEGILEAMADQFQSATEVPATHYLTLDRFLKGYLAAIAAEPTMARTYFVEVYAAGPAAIEKRIAMQNNFANLLIQVVGADDDQVYTCRAAMAGIGAIVTQALLVDMGAHLEEQHADMLSFLATTLEAVGIDLGR